MKLKLGSILILIFIMIFLLSFYSGNGAKNKNIDFTEYKQNILFKLDVNESSFNFEDINGTEDAEQLYSKYLNNFVSKISYTFVDVMFDLIKMISVKGYTYDGKVDVVNIIKIITIVIIIEILFFPLIIVGLLIYHLVKKVKEKKGVVC